MLRLQHRALAVNPPLKQLARCSNRNTSSCCKKTSELRAHTEEAVTKNLKEHSARTGTRQMLNGTIEASEDCFKKGSSWWPLDMSGEGRSVTDLHGCQKRCAMTPGCVHFSWWPDGGCHLQDGNAQRTTKNWDPTSGPRSCDMSLWQERAPQTSKFSEGCCRFDPPWKSTPHGDKSSEECRGLCDEDNTCLAAELWGTACYTYHGEGVNFHASCDTGSQSKNVCYWKQPVAYKTMHFMRHVQVHAREKRETCDSVAGAYFCSRAWTTGTFPRASLPASIEECVADCAKNDDCFGANIDTYYTCRQLKHSSLDDSELSDSGQKGWYFQKS